jgi:hypothetical protein
MRLIFVFLSPEYFLVRQHKKYPSLQILTLHSHETLVNRKVKGKSRGSSKGHMVTRTSCAPLDHPDRDS